MKSCIKCLTTKSTLLFPKGKARCKECLSAYNKQYKQDNIEILAAKGKEYAKNNAVAIATKKKQYNVDNAEKIAVRAKQYYADHIEQETATRKLYNKKNAVRIAAKNAVYKPEYMRNNKGVVNANVAKRRVAKLNRTPKWNAETDLWMMKETYILAELRTRLTGISCHVDHIIPLQGKLVSGLHTPFNMQVIPATQNISKGNRFEL